MGKIRNTTKEVNENPGAFLGLGMLIGGSNAIEYQEAVGQAELVNSSDLPTEGSENPVWAKMGVTFGPPHADDPLFRPATLPPGWKKVGSDHAMHSDLVDDKGRVRGGIFYKAAFYDRKAMLSTRRRFDVGYAEKYDPDTYQRRVLDQGKEVFATAPESVAGLKGPPYGEVTKRHEAACEVWLAERFPDWRDASAYWDD